MSKSTHKKVVSNPGPTSGITRDRFRARYQCYSNNPDLLRALVEHQLPEKTDLAVRVHVWNCSVCCSEYLALKAELANEAPSQALNLPSQTTTREDADFRELLRGLLSGQKLRDELLLNPVFQRRLPSICQSFARNAADADDLTNYVRAMVCERLDQFEPDYKRPYGNFFIWVSRIARNKYIDDCRRRSIHPDDSRLDYGFTVEGVKVDAQGEAERNEAIERFWVFVDKRDEVTQKVMHYHLEDNSLREIQNKLAAEGIELSHVAIGNVVRRVMADFLASENSLAGSIRRKREHQSRGRERDSPFTRNTDS